VVHRPRLDEQTAISHAGRAVPGYRAAAGEDDFRKDRRDQPPTRHHHSAGGTERESGPGGLPLRLRPGDRPDYPAERVLRPAAEPPGEKRVSGRNLRTAHTVTARSPSPLPRP